MREGLPVYGTAVLSPSPLWPEAVSSTGVDFVFIDTEHTPLERETVSWMSKLFMAYDVAPLVRIPSPDPYLASMALDGGAAGIIAPYVETPEEVEALVSAVKYKPVKGNRIGALHGMREALEPVLFEYLADKNRKNVLVINIESSPAIDALDDILAVEGLDGVLIGPHDLTCSLGIPEQYDHPLFRSSVETIISKARKSGVGVGVHTWSEIGADQEIYWAKSGANIIMHSSDLHLFRDTLKTNLDHIKKRTGS